MAWLWAAACSTRADWVGFHLVGPVLCTLVAPSTNYLHPSYLHNPTLLSPFHYHPYTLPFCHLLPCQPHQLLLLIGHTSTSHHQVLPLLLHITLTHHASHSFFLNILTSIPALIDSLLPPSNCPPPLSMQHPYISIFLTSLYVKLPSALNPTPSHPSILKLLNLAYSLIVRDTVRQHASVVWKHSWAVLLERQIHQFKRITEFIHSFHLTQ